MAEKTMASRSPTLSRRAPPMSVPWVI
jgi:hypothetical protein